MAVALGLVLVSAGDAVAQRNSVQPETSHPKATASSNIAKLDSPDADNDYSRQIVKYTTEPYFRTELVDHLPMSDKVPSPTRCWAM